MNQTSVHKIRPAGRLLLTIGRDLIQDVHAAVVELVKNAYDADSPDVSIEFTGINDIGGYSIIIADHGHGMTRDDVINKWMVPSTQDKLKRRRSPSGRVMQGRKGIGRYAASVLGTDLLLETVSTEGEKTEVFVEWQEFEDSEYLDDVEILVETNETSCPAGTRLTISGDSAFTESWDETQFNKLRFELRKLKSPVEKTLNNDDFLINLTMKDFPNVEAFSEAIEPYSVFELFDYRISGNVNTDGKGTLYYSTQKTRNIPDEIITFDYGDNTSCGELFLDIRVYDRDKESINSLIGRGEGLKDDSGNYIGSLRARQILNQYNGVGVYRNGFRIRPLGDPDFDWLQLNRQRVQSPSLRISSNQVIGFVQIQSDEQSGLIEKSARDGLIENQAYDNLKKITQKIIGELESRRFIHRRRTGLTKPSAKVESDLNRLFSSDTLKENVQTRLSRAGVSVEDAKEIIDAISQDQEEKNKAAENIRQAVAIYQGQATLGKIMNVVLHEGRRPLNYFRNEIDNLRYWHKSFLETGDKEKLHKIMSISDGISRNAEIFVSLFKRLDPLASGKRSRKKQLNIRKEIHDSISIFATILKSQNVTVCLECPGEFEFPGWSQDIHAIFTNLIENSLYWIDVKGCEEKRIMIDVITEDKSLIHIDYRDTGLGIDPALIASEVLFEPQFSTKPNGTGIGLAIAGEAAARNNLELRALESETGAWFRLQSTLEDVE